MNTNRYGSAAYDFDLFLPAEKRERPDNVTPLPKRTPKTKKNTAAGAKTAPRRAPSKRISSFLAIVFMLGMVCGIIFSRVQISETREQINQASRQLETLEREEVRLNMLIENKAAYQNLEQEAAALGMQKPTAQQIRYIALGGKDKVEIKNRDPGNLFAFLGGENQE